MSISLNMQGVYRNNKKMSIGAHNDKGHRFNKSDYDHIYNMYKLYMNNKLNKFKKVTVSGYHDGKKLFTCNIDISNLRHNYYTIIHYYMTNLELMIMRKNEFK